MVRGVSTTFLHRAAQTAFQQRGWRPLLYFTNATVYGGDPIDRPVLAAAEEVRGLLKEEIDAAIVHDVTPLMVGSPTGNILPKPDLSGSRLRTPGVSPGVKASSRRLARFSYLTLVLGVAFDFEVPRA